MERRRSQRIIIGFHADIVSNGNNYKGEIENLSEDGVLVVIAPADAAEEHKPGSMLTLKFRTLSGERLSLQCEVMWSNKTKPHEMTRRVGMKIIDPPWDKTSFFI